LELLLELRERAIVVKVMEQNGLTNSSEGYGAEWLTTKY